MTYLNGISIDSSILRMAAAPLVTTLRRTVSAPSLLGAKIGCLAEARKELQQVPPFIASSKVLRQTVLIRTNIFISSSVNCRVYSLSNIRNSLKITFRGAQKFKKHADRAKTQFTRVFVLFLSTELFDAYPASSTP
jgi:hypothetical protein